MKLVRPSVFSLRRIAKKKKIICFGVGQLFFNFFSAHIDDHLLECIEYAVDNSVSTVPSTVNVGDKHIQVMSPSCLKYFDDRKNIILITTGKYNEVFAQIQNLTNNVNTVVYSLPNRYYSLSIFLEKIYTALPLKNYILLKGPNDTCDNTEALGRYIRKEKYFKGKYKLVWLCDSNDHKYPNSEKVIYNNAPTKAVGLKSLISYYRYYGRAKYLIYENQHLRKMRSDQIMIYLNHGSPPLKATKGIINLPSNLNYAVSPSDYSSNIISEQYSINIERIIVCGSPRTDIFFEKDKEETEIFINYKLENYRHTILWTPTFRQRAGTTRVDSDALYEFGLPLIHTEKELEVLNQALNEKNILLIVKPHLLQNKSVYQIINKTNIKLMLPEELKNADSNVYELMICMDAMITDYSTIAFDYMLLNKPIAYTIDDIDSYKLGFSVDNIFSLMPGYKMSSFSDLLSFIEMVDNDDDFFADEREKVNKLIHKDLDGNSARKLCRLLHLME